MMPIEQHISQWLFIFSQHDLTMLALKFVPFFLFLELPIYILIAVGVTGWYWENMHKTPISYRYFPRVSCMVICYGEGRRVIDTIKTLVEQVYDGPIEILVVIDGAAQNQLTLHAARSLINEVNNRPNRTMKIIPKWQRGGRVSSLNTGLAVAYGEILIAADGDTSFDNDMVYRISRHFIDPNVPAVAGSLRARHTHGSLTAAIQGIEYLISIQAAKTGLGFWNLVNNVSGAFGAFRTETLRKIGGWDVSGL